MLRGGTGEQPSSQVKNKQNIHNHQKCRHQLATEGLSRHRVTDVIYTRLFSLSINLQITQLIILSIIMQPAVKQISLLIDIPDGHHFFTF